MQGAGKDAHVDAALGDQDPRCVDPDAGDGEEQFDQLGVGFAGGADAGVEGGDRLLERLDVGEQPGDEVGEGLAQLGIFVRSLGFASSASRQGLAGARTVTFG